MCDFVDATKRLDELLTDSTTPRYKIVLAEETYEKMVPIWGERFCRKDAPTLEPDFKGWFSTPRGDCVQVWVGVMDPKQVALLWPPRWAWIL